MEVLQTFRFAAVFILFGLFVMIGGCNWWCVYIGLRHKLYKSSERVPLMIFVGWIFLILGSIIYPFQTAPSISLFWLFVIPAVDPSIGYTIYGLFVLSPYSFVWRLLSRNPQQ